MKVNPLLRLREFGQMVWLDYIHRHIIESGELARLIEEDGLRGVTSNPSIFEKAIVESHDYDEEIESLSRQSRSAEEISEILTVKDVADAADLFRPYYDRSGGGEGFVSLEVNPHLAHDTEATISEARRFWEELNRPNVFIKVPASEEGLPAIRRLTSEGINVNVTLLFGLPRYRQVAEAYIAGIEDRLAAGKPVEGIISVASFFLSRIDVMVDPVLEGRIREGDPEAEKAKALLGQVAIASAKQAYQIYKGLFRTDRFARLLKEKARPQWVLWASTGTKNPEYSDVKYIEPLIGPETINTMPVETLNAYRDHGKPEPRLAEDVEEALRILQDLAEVGIDLDRVTQQLEEEGEEKFNKPYDKLLSALRKKVAALREGGAAIRRGPGGTGEGAQPPA